MTKPFQQNLSGMAEQVRSRGQGSGYKTSPVWIIFPYCAREVIMHFPEKGEWNVLVEFVVKQISFHVIYACFDLVHSENYIVNYIFVV